MKKSLIACAFAAAFAVVSIEAKAQDTPSGWSFGPLPCVSFDSNLGLQYGICADIIDYADGSMFPWYKQHIYVEASRYTKGQTLLHAQYDSQHLIPGVSFSAALSYYYDPLYYFYGFNGGTPYDPSLHLNADTQTALYSMQRNMVRGLVDFQGKIAGDLKWVAGASLWSFRMQDFKNDQFNAATSLYHQYVASGLISANEAEGGTHIEAKAGLAFDSRDQVGAPNHGIQAEAYLNASPALFEGATGYLRLAAHWRHYVPIKYKTLTLAYHLAYQSNLAGTTPYYMLPVTYALTLRQTGNEGVGGLNTVRGLLQNRLVGDGMAWTNVELRARLVNFSFIGSQWYLAVNPFFDAGYVTKMYKAEELALASAMTLEDYTKTAERFDCSAGLGLKLAMDENFIISVELAQVLGHKEYPLGTIITLNYIF